MGASEFRFFLSCDINSQVTFRIEKLDGVLSVKNSTDSARGFGERNCEMVQRNPTEQSIRDSGAKAALSAVDDGHAGLQGSEEAMRLCCSMGLEKPPREEQLIMNAYHQNSPNFPDDLELSLLS